MGPWCIKERTKLAVLAALSAVFVYIECLVQTFNINFYSSACVLNVLNVDTNSGSSEPPFLKQVANICSLPSHQQFRKLTNPLFAKTICVLSSAPVILSENLITRFLKIYL